MAKIEITLAAILTLSQAGMAQTKDQTPAKPGAEQKEDLTSLDLNDLSNMSVTSASKKAESAFGVGAAIYVVTGDDIKRSGAANLPEALRIVPGIQVRQLDAIHYAVSARGFSQEYATSLLVLIDGRSIYNNLFGGVYWDDESISLDEIDHIEVIRGPGGSIWGANAVNGIINVITKSAKDTKGGFLSTEFGSQINKTTDTLRYGSSLSHGDFRVTAFGMERGQSLTSAGSGASDNWEASRLNFRYDGGSDTTGKLLLEATTHRNWEYGTSQVPMSTSPYQSPVRGIGQFLGNSLLVKTDKTDKDGSSNSLQVTFDNEDRNTAPLSVERSSTWDVQYQHGFKNMGANSLIGGLEYRTVSDQYTPGVLSPNSATFQLFSGFIQDQIQLNKISKLVLGTKLEHNDFSGFEIQPSARVTIQPNENHAYWFSSSRAVATPNRIYENGLSSQGYFPSQQGPVESVLVGDDFKSMALFALEAGYRAKVSDKMTVDASIYHNSYQNLTGIAQGTPGYTTTPFGHIVVPINIIAAGNGFTNGLEISSRIQVAKDWKLDLGYAYAIADQDAGTTAFATPRHEIKALSTYTASKKLSFDQGIYFSAGEGTMPGYTKVDLQVRYKATEGCELTVGGRNLGQGNYSQVASSTFQTANLIQPELYAKIAWKF